MGIQGFKPLLITGFNVPDFDNFGYNFFDGLRALTTAFENLDIYFSSNVHPFLSNNLSNGQILIGNSGGAPIRAILTAGNNITIVNGPGSITISSNGGGWRWNTRWVKY